ncbi:MAG: carbon-nitrogen family hydrolase [Planctomycetes bacterium]|nr:carbon-nitrogen family hydrolase [Planctomycetota bacterium]
MRIAAFQFSPIPADAAGNLAIVEDALRRAAAANVKLIGLPEMWPTSFAFGAAERAVEASERALDAICKLSKQLGIVIVGSALARSGIEKPYNSAHVVDGGEVIYKYAKTHLFLPTREDSLFQAGASAPAVVETSAGRVSAVICYDLRFPEICRGAFTNQADVVVVPAQWAGERMLQFRALIAGRAVENQCAYIGINRTGSETGPLGNTLHFPGRSLVADAFGEIAAEAGPADELLVADVDFDRQRALRRLIPCEKSRRPDLY